MTYDTLGRPNVQTNANGNVTTLYFAGSRTEMDDPAGDVMATYFTPHGKTAAMIAGLGAPAINSGAGILTSAAYDGRDRPSLITLPEGGTIAYTYSSDLLDNLTKTVQTPKPGSPLSPLTTLTSYDPVWNKPASITDPLGLVTSFSYDSKGNLVQQIGDVGGGSHFNTTSQFTYDSNTGLVLTSTDPLGVVNQYTYDGFGNQTMIVRNVGGLNQTTRMSYDAIGNVLTLTDPNTNVTSSTYDADRRQVTTTLPVAGGAALVTTTTYDANDNVTRVQKSANGVVPRTSSQTYSLTDKVATATDPNGNVTRYAYDVVDRLASVTDPLGRVTAYGYDALSRQIGVSNPAIQVAPLLSKQFTLDGMVSSLTDANSKSTSYAYDGFDRLATSTYPTTPAYPSGTTETFTYDADGNILTQKTRANATITLTYDTLNRLATKAAPSEATVTYSYDLNGHVIGASQDSSATAITTATTAAVYTTTTTYDSRNHPLTVTWSPAATPSAPTASSVMFTHAYDGTNRRVAQGATDSSWWSYPTTASNTSYSVNNLSQYSAVGSVTPTYDGNGNLTYDGTFTYGYDAESRLLTITQGGTTVASYAYDAQGRRKLKCVGGTLPACTGGNATTYVTDADNREVLEYNGAGGATQAWYAYGSGSNEVLNRMNITAGTRQTMLPDIQGSIIGTLDSSGNLSKAGYQPFGENPTNYAGSFRYIGGRIDPETGGSAAQPSGLYYLRTRMYSPALGRFLQTDSIGYNGGTNLYAYTGNDPLNGSDPSGLLTMYLQGSGSVISGIGVMISGGAYFTTNNAYGIPDVGLFRAPGVGVGANVSVGGSAGFSLGGINNFRGRTFNIDAGAGIIGATASFTPAGNPSQTLSSNNFAGASAGLSFGLPASLDLSTTTTKAGGLLENVVIPAVNSVLSDFGVDPISPVSSNGGSSTSQGSSPDGGRS